MKNKKKNNLHSPERDDLETTQAKYVVVKAAFSCRDIHKSGLIALFINNCDPFQVDIFHVVERKTESLAYDLDQDWKEFSEVVLRLRFKGETSTRSTEALGKVLERFVASGDAAKLLSPVNGKEGGSAEDLLRGLVAEALDSADPEISLVRENVTESEYTAVPLPVFSTSTTEDMVVKVNLALDPVGGTSVRNLVLGDMIWVNILRGPDTESYVANLLTDHKGPGKPPPLRATIEEIKHLDQDAAEIIVRLTPYVLGRSVLMLDLKIKRAYQPETPVALVDDEEKFRSEAEQHQSENEPEAGVDRQKQDDSFTMLVVFMMILLMLALLLSIFYHYL